MLSRLWIKNTLVTFLGGWFALCMIHAWMIHVSFYNIYFNKYFYRIDGGTWYTMKSCFVTNINLVCALLKSYNVNETIELFLKNVARHRRFFLSLVFTLILTLAFSLSLSFHEYTKILHLLTLQFLELLERRKWCCIFSLLFKFIRLWKRKEIESAETFAA